MGIIVACTRIGIKGERRGIRTKQAAEEVAMDTMAIRPRRS